MTSPQVETLKACILDAARRLDDGDVPGSLAKLREVPLTEAIPSLRLVALSVWGRIIGETLASRPADRNAAVTLTSKAHAAIQSPGAVWYAYEALPELERTLGSEDASALIASALWDVVLDAPEPLFATAFDVLGRGSPAHCVDAWRQFLIHRDDYVPTYWQFGLAAKLLGASFSRLSGKAIVAKMELAGRDDLAALFSVYAVQMRQVPIGKILAAARKVKAPRQRHRIAQMMLGMGYMPEELPAVVRAFADLIPGADSERESLAVMRARLAGSEERWEDALEQADIAAESPAMHLTAQLLRANALAHLARCEEASGVLDDVASDEQATPFVHARAAFLRVSNLLAEAGEAFPEHRPEMEFAATPGRPLVQSLWVGPRLRWIEQLAIKSYLDNGWRFQLYTYEDVENVPAGCEVLDASAIIPTREVFKEGGGSGLHAGSVGAFSDLFRYKMLYERGGMWTDTDVINLKRYDPDGRRFISTELSDAGTVTLNGAMMAAPAGDPFVAVAYERARDLLLGDDMFFTRIGPYLLAELIIDRGVNAIDLAPLGFLSPINWMNTGSLLQPFEAVSGRPEFKNASNLHVYTEMWRILGLGLDKPPAATTYLGKLYEHHCVGHDAAARVAASA